MAVNQRVRFSEQGAGSFNLEATAVGDNGHPARPARQRAEGSPGHGLELGSGLQGLGMYRGGKKQDSSNLLPAYVKLSLLQALVMVQIMRGMIMRVM